MRLSCLFGLAAVMCMATAAEAQVRFNQDGFLLVNGKPRLVLGIYDLPKIKEPKGLELSDLKIPPKDREAFAKAAALREKEAVLQEIADSGFDVIRGEAKKETLDLYHAHGLHAWLRLRDLELSDEDPTVQEKLVKSVEDFKDHPALFCWEGPDETLWGVYWDYRGWFFEDQPAMLREMIDKAAAEGNPNAAKYESLLSKAADYTDRAMLKELIGIANDPKASDAAKHDRMLAKAVDYANRAMLKESEELYAALWRELGKENPRPKPLSQLIRERSEGLVRGWKCVREHDAAHFCWQNHAPCNAIADLRLYNQGVDVAGCDIYPAPPYSGVRHGDLLPTMELTAVGAATDLMREAAPGKSCWMGLQGFGWFDLGPNPKEPTDKVRGRRPNWQETRFMAYDALLHHANGLLYWGTRYIERESQLWNEVLKIGKELRALEPAIVATESPVHPVVAAETNWTTFKGGDPKLMLRQVGDDWVLIAVNEWRTSVAFEVQNLPKTLDGKTLYRLYFDEEHVVKNSCFRDGILGHDVHVYATSRRFEAK